MKDAFADIEAYLTFPTHIYWSIVFVGCDTESPQGFYKTFGAFKLDAHKHSYVTLFNEYSGELLIHFKEVDGVWTRHF